MALVGQWAEEGDGPMTTDSQREGAGQTGRHRAVGRLLKRGKGGHFKCQYLKWFFLH